MLRTVLVRKLAIVVGFLAVGNLLATVLHWYGILWWLDMPAHFLGGVSVFYGCAIILLPKLKKGVSQQRLILYAVIGAVSLGIAWEILQYGLYVFANGKQPIFLDVLSDIGFDFAGTAYGGAVLARIFRNDIQR